MLNDFTLELYRGNITGKEYLEKINDLIKKYMPNTYTPAIQTKIRCEREKEKRKMWRKRRRKL